MKYWLPLLALCPAALFAGQANQPNALDLQRASLKLQRESLKKQPNTKLELAASDFEFLPQIVPLVQTADCAALDSDTVESLIESASKRHSVSPAILRAVMRQESGFKPCAVSVKGAQGLMQLMPATADQFQVSDRFDPEQNVQAGAAFLHQLLKKYGGDLRLALVAYNAGAARADQLAPSEYPLETQDYVANIMSDLGQTVPAESASAPVRP